MAVPHRTPITPRQIEWLAGLLEGEGCFSKVGYRVREGLGTVAIFVNMTDRDVIEKAAALLGSKVVTFPRPPGYKPQWRTLLYGDRAAGWMMTLLPLMGKRRRARITALLAHWQGRPLSNAKKHHCPRGHPFDRLHIRRDRLDRDGRPRVERVCRTCHRVGERNRRRYRLPRTSRPNSAQGAL
jgi:hypothetical protein